MKHKDVGDALRAARVKQRLSTRAAEALTGISYSSISRYEKGSVDPSYIYMVRMCHSYAIELSEIASIIRPLGSEPVQRTTPPSRNKVANSTTLGRALRAGREAKGLSTRAVDKETGVSHVNISRYETEQSMPSFTAVVRMCDLYDIAIDELAHTVGHRGRS